MLFSNAQSLVACCLRSKAPRFWDLSSVPLLSGGLMDNWPLFCPCPLLSGSPNISLIYQRAFKSEPLQVRGDIRGISQAFLHFKCGFSAFPFQVSVEFLLESLLWNWSKLMASPFWGGCGGWCYVAPPVGWAKSCIIWPVEWGLKGDREKKNDKNHDWWETFGRDGGG